MHKKLVFLLGSTCYIETYFYLEEFQSYLQRSTNLTHSNILCFKYPSTSTSYENVGRPQAFATSALLREDNFANCNKSLESLEYALPLMSTHEQII